MWWDASVLSKTYFASKLRYLQVRISGSSYIWGKQGKNKSPGLLTSMPIKLMDLMGETSLNSLKDLPITIIKCFILPIEVKWMSGLIMRLLFSVSVEQHRKTHHYFKKQILYWCLKEIWTAYIPVSLKNWGSQQTPVSGKL